MKVLSFLNVSNIDNLNCDSGFIFQKQLGISLIELGYDFTLVIPGHIIDDQIPTLYYNFGDDKFQVRYSFNWFELSNIIKLSNADIIISNQPELTSNIKAVIISEQIEVKLYTYIHYFPFSLNKSGNILLDTSLNNSNFGNSIIFSFISGLFASDKILVHSNYAIFLLENLFKQFNISKILDNTIIMPPPYDDYIANQGLSNQDSNFILYNHRLYKQYGTEFLIKLIQECSWDQSVKFLISDLLFNRNHKRIILDTSVEKYRNELLRYSNVVFRSDGNNRETYSEILSISKIGMAPYRKNCTWSMSIIDCMSIGLPVVSPKFAWFKDFIPQELLFESKDDLYKIINSLFYDSHFYEDMSYIVKDKIINKSYLNRMQIATAFANIG